MSRLVGSKNKLRNPMCLQGHNKDITGRRPGGACAICAMWANRISRQNPEISRRHKAYNREWQWQKVGLLNESLTSFKLADYDRLYQIQQGRCKICNTHQTGSKSVFDVDHNHKTQIVRGLLCHGCNIKVGAFDSPLASKIKLYLGENF